MTVNIHIEKTAQAIAFLTRFPIPDRFFENDDTSLAETAGYFSITGFLISLPICIMAALLHGFSAHPMIIAILVLVLHTLITGALHEDGLADSVDGLWGGSDKENILMIMKDSRLGTYGAITLIFSVFLKFAALVQLFDNLGITGIICTIICANSLSRGAMVWHWYTLPCIRDKGIASTVGAPSKNSMRLIIKTCVFITLMCLIGLGVLPTVFSVFSVIAISFYFTKLVNNKLGGHTGDTIGATQQLSEVVFLTVLALMI